MLLELANQYLLGEIETIEEVVDKFNNFLFVEIKKVLDEERKGQYEDRN